MYKLIATIIKDARVLLRDRVGLLFMFLLPVLLVMIVTGIQRGTFEMANRKKVPLLVYNRDTGNASRQLIRAVDTLGLFQLLQPTDTAAPIQQRIQRKEALLGVVIPADFSLKIRARANFVTGKALNSFGLDSGAVEGPRSSGPAGSAGQHPSGPAGGAGQHPSEPAGGAVGHSEAANDSQQIALFYHPVLQPSLRESATGALYSALQLVQSRQILRTLYLSINEKELPDSLEKQLLNNRASITERPVSREGMPIIPNASQHNIPAWTIFAMYFVVISLGSGIVREKLNGSFIRLKTLPTSYVVAIFSKQFTYMAVTVLQAALIFAIGIWLFPPMGLPPLHFPHDWPALIVVTLLCGWSAVSYAICVGVFAQTEEQANGIGAVSIVILAAIGGLMVPSFAMPGSFKTAMNISPLHWCLEAYYDLFLEGGGLKDVWNNLLPLLFIIAALQGLSFWGLKRKNLI